jgi:ankyrin repeat protein
VRDEVLDLHESPFWHAAANGHHEVIMELFSKSRFEKELDTVCARKSFLGLLKPVRYEMLYTTPLMIAIEQGHEKAVLLLLAKTRDKTLDAYLSAVAEGMTSIVEEIHTMGWPLSRTKPLRDDAISLIRAIERRDAEAIKVLLQYCDVNSNSLIGQRFQFHRNIASRITMPRRPKYFSPTLISIPLQRSSDPRLPMVMSR